LTVEDWCMECGTLIHTLATYLDRWLLVLFWTVRFMTTGVCRSLYQAVSLSECPCWSHSFSPLVSILCIRNWFHLVVFFCSCSSSCLGDALHKSLSSVISNPIGVKWTLAGLFFTLSRWRPWRPYTQTIATTMRMKLSASIDGVGFSIIYVCLTFDVTLSWWWPWRHFTQKIADIWWVLCTRSIHPMHMHQCQPAAH